MATALTIDPEIISQPLNEANDPAAVLVTFAKQRGAFALESVCNTSGFGGHSIFGYDPIDSLEVSLCDADDPFDALQRAVDAQPLFDPPSRFGQCGRVDPGGCVPMIGGWVGVLPYEAGHRVEDPGYRCIPDNPLLNMRFDLYDTVAVLDHRRRVWTVFAVDLPQSTTSASQRARQMARRIAEAEPPRSETLLLESPAGPVPVPDVVRSVYLNQIRMAQGFIASGDIYQVNLSQRFTTQTALSPLDLYLRLRTANPADFAAYLAWNEQAALSSSPELFFRVNADGGIVTRPIKGTHPRGPRHGDEAARQYLRSNPKERAELNMIIDLLRNDLGKICDFGSVKVIADADVEAHPTVYHLVATIVGQQRHDIRPADVLRAAFPGGSITGCPKLRAMQIIDQLEVAPRGPYCGSIGYIDLAGRMNFNIAIRTLSYDRGQLNVHAGSAITADSDPESEYLETLAKAEGLFRALGHSTERLT